MNLIKKTPFGVNYISDEPKYPHNPSIFWEVCHYLVWLAVKLIEKGGNNKKFIYAPKPSSRLWPRELDHIREKFDCYAREYKRNHNKVHGVFHP